MERYHLTDKRPHEEAFERRKLDFMDKPYDHDPHYQNILNEVTNYHKTLLDVGCGPGILYSHMVGVAKYHHILYTGYDFTKKFIDHNKETYPFPVWIHGNILNAKPAIKYDVVVSKDMFAHMQIEDIDTALEVLINLTRYKIILSLFRPTIKPDHWHAGWTRNKEILTDVSIPKIVGVLYETGFKEIKVTKHHRMQTLIVGRRQ